jgi:hypothetical protein
MLSFLSSLFLPSQFAPRPSDFFTDARRYWQLSPLILASTGPLSPPFSYLQLPHLIAHLAGTVW